MTVLGSVKRHYEKVICVCCFLILFTNIGLPSTSFSVYQPYLVAIPGVGHAGGSVILSVRTFAIIFVKENIVHFSRCNSIVDKFSWIFNPLNNINIFLNRNFNSCLSIQTCWVETADNFLDVTSTTTNDSTNSINVRVMTANSNFGTITSFTRHAHDFYSSIKYFRNFLFHDTFDEFWMATAYKDVNTLRVVFNFININIDDVV